MATQQSHNQPEEMAQPTAQVVGNAFVHQFYHILQQSPELVHRFYQDTSKLGRPDAEGGMNAVTTLQAINEKILSLDYCKYKGEIKTIDAQKSLDGGVIVLVTGFLKGEDGTKRGFAQSFFLAPQDKGYFVLNDIFRYTDGSAPQQGSQDVHQVPEMTLVPVQDTTQSQDKQIPEQSTPHKEEQMSNMPEVLDPSDSEEGSVVDEELPINEVVVEVPKVSQPVVERCTASVLEETPKKSYASIVKVMKENVAPLSLPPHSVVKPVPVKQERQVNVAQTSSLAPEFATSNSITIADNGTAQEIEGQADGFSIYIKNLPMNATPAQLQEEFKRFGPIKYDGIQVRSHKQGFCFGFVEFEVATAVQSAIEASPIMIGGRQAYVEEKRASASRVNNRGRFAPGRGGGFRNDGVRHGNFGGRGYARGDFVNRVDLGNRVGGRGDRGDRGYHGVEDGGRTNRPGGMGANTSKNMAPRVAVPA